ncbi:MAG: hypothetical protein IJZ80_10440 [Clostridia bacterium]|nr:hypothetical protein [Clostridia bacterium]
MKKLISVILLLTMLLTVLAACGEDEKPPVDTSEDEETETQEPNYLDDLPTLDYGGQEFKMLISSQHETFYNQDHETGAIVENACYLRNIAIEDRYNIALFYTAMDGNASGKEAFAAAVLNSTQSAATDAFNIVIGQNYYCLPLVASGAYHNLRESEVIDFEAEWAHKAINNNGTVNGKLYGASGAFVVSQLTHALAIYYNKDIWEDYGFAEQYDIYQIVRDGQWTWELFFQFVTSFDGVDVNDPNAVFGFENFYHALIGLHTGMGNDPITKNDQGEYTVDNYYNDRLESIYSRIRELVNDHAAVADNATIMKVAGSSENMMDHLLFCMNYLHGLVESPAFQKSDNHALGVLPAPKYDENQEEYYTRIMRGDLYYIPKNVDLEVASLLVEALNYETYKIVYPEYWGKVIELRSPDTSEDQEMIRLLSATVHSSFAEYYTGDLLAIHQQVAIEAQKNSASMSGWWGSNEKVVRRYLEKMLETYG